MRPVKDVLLEFVPHITIFLVAGVISYQFMPKAPEVEQVLEVEQVQQPVSDTLKLYQDYAKLQKLKDYLWDEYYEEYVKLTDIISDDKSAAIENPDDIETMRKWLQHTRRYEDVRRKYSKADTRVEEEMDEILKQLEKLGEPPPG